ncbi:MAG: N-formylglutamate amidohydrolase, partial [Candidatus Cloacimonetes bacterium]|nr:N-formylglutamate amidohydrolase [Candidatus Cloacimonadota bacterium]
EEDPYTEFFTETCGNNIVVRLSRFEVDLNRSRDKAIYLKPSDAWGLQVRREPPESEVLQESLAKYDWFYLHTARMLHQVKNRFGNFFIYDIHSYNHRRHGPLAEPDDPHLNPEINLGYNSIPLKYKALIPELQQKLAEQKLGQQRLDVRINVKFTSGYFANWVHENFPDSACCVSVEFKKIFMDEWSGELDPDKIFALRKALQSTFPVVLKYLQELGNS